MSTLRDLIDTPGKLLVVGDVHAVGTSEGASKAWDTRGRGSVKTAMGGLGYRRQGGKFRYQPTGRRETYEHSNGSRYQVTHKTDSAGKPSGEIGKWAHYNPVTGHSRGEGAAELQKHMFGR